MTMIGIRELKTHLSKYLKKLKKGEAFEITEHGQPIAMVTPVPKSDSDELMWKLVREEKIDWNGGKPKGMKHPILSRGKKSASELVLEDRADRL